MLHSGNHLDLIGEDDKIFNLHLLMAFNFILNLAGRISPCILHDEDIREIEIFITLIMLGVLRN
ncbi:hypothetical protein T01_3239, partial [Trichinella spiralis]